MRGFYGHKHSDATKQKMREHHVDFKGPHTKETKGKISETLLEGYKTGRYVCPNTGKHLSKETKKKQSETLKEGYATGKYIGFWKNKHHSEESKKKISESLKDAYKTGRHIYSTKGKHPSEETKKKMSISHSGEKHHLWGKHHSEESKHKMSLRRIGRYVGENSSFYGRHHTEETKRKIRESTLGAKHHSFGKHPSVEHRHRQSIAALRNWQNEDIAKKRIEAFNLKPNGMELYLDFILQNYFPDEWKFVGDGQVIIGGLCPDFINVNGKKKIIELFGYFWHKGKASINGVLEHRTGEGRKKVFAEIGYDTLVIWDAELVDENKVVDKINNFVSYDNGVIRFDEKMVS